MQYRQQQLDNGLTVLAECNDQAQFLSLGFFVRTGSRDEQPVDGGVSHFLEHMVFKGTQTRSADEVNLLLDDMGSSSNARTSEESTIYHASVLPEFQTPAVELLADLMRPALRDEDFALEKKVIIEEIMMYEDQPPWGGYERLMQQYFGDGGLGQSVLGSVESVTGLNPDRMRAYHASRYAPGNVALVAAGKVDFGQLVRDAERFCGNWEPQPVGRTLTAATPSFGFECRSKDDAHLEYLLHLAPGPAVDSPDRYAVRMLGMILGDSSGSRVFWKMLDTGLADSAGVGGHEYLGAGLMMAYFCCMPDRAAKNAELMHEILATAPQGVTEREVELARQKVIAQILLASEHTETRMFSVGGQWLNSQPFITPAQIAERYRQVTLDAVNEAARRWPLAAGRTLAIGACEELAWNSIAAG